jgi:hypothetical protein
MTVLKTEAPPPKKKKNIEKLHIFKNAQLSVLDGT